MLLPSNGISNNDNNILLPLNLITDFFALNLIFD